jgi:hypothetical protein
MLKGPSLLDHIKRQPSTTTREDLARGAGYVTTTKTGAERINTTRFFEALLEAKGELPPSERSTTGSSSGGPTPSYIATVHGNGQIVLGKCYVSQLVNPNPGAEYDIVIQPGGGLSLNPRPNTDDATDED